MPVRPLALALLALAAVPASAQEADDDAPPRWSRFAVVGVGAASNGPSARALLGSEARLGHWLSLGLASRLAAARGPYPVDGTEAADDLYAEFGVSLRPSARLSDRVQVAASAGYGIATVMVRDGDGRAVDDLGFTLPLEAEASVRVWRGVGVAVGASRSVALGSAASESEALSVPAGYALDHWTATVGLRVGRW